METIAADLRQMQRTLLAEVHVAALRPAGTEVAYPAGAFIARPGDPAECFRYVEDGEIEVVNAYTNERHLPSAPGPTQFMGEIALLSGGAWSMAMRAVRDTRVIEVPCDKLLTLMAQIPEMPDIIIAVLAARRRRQIEDRDSTLTLIGEDVDRSVRQITEFASRNRVPYTSVPLDSPEARATRAPLTARRSAEFVLRVAKPLPAGIRARYWARRSWQGCYEADRLPSPICNLARAAGLERALLSD